MPSGLAESCGYCAPGQPLCAPEFTEPLNLALGKSGMKESEGMLTQDWSPTQAGAQGLAKEDGILDSDFRIPLRLSEGSEGRHFNYRVV